MDGSVRVDARIGGQADVRGICVPKMIAEFKENKKKMLSQDHKDVEECRV
jgi:hypothetical protein